MERKQGEREKASKRSSMRLHSFRRLAAQVTEAESRSGDAVLQLHQAGNTQTHYTCLECGANKHPTEICCRD